MNNLYKMFCELYCGGDGTVRQANDTFGLQCSFYKRNRTRCKWRIKLFSFEHDQWLMRCEEVKLTLCETAQCSRRKE